MKPKAQVGMGAALQRWAMFPMTIQRYTRKQPKPAKATAMQGMAPASPTKGKSKKPTATRAVAGR